MILYFQIFTSFMFIALLVISFRYIKLKKLIKEYNKINTGRYGFYVSKRTSSIYTSYVYITELDRYTNGYSKVEINRIEPFDKYYKNDSIMYAKQDFKSLILTSEIEWLKSEDHIKKLRKEKLDKINKN